MMEKWIDCQAYSAASTLLEVLQQHAVFQPQGLAYLFLEEGETESVCCTYARLEHRARTLGGHLRQKLPAGSRALLLYDCGPHFIETWLGCLYAGVIPIAAPCLEPGRERRTLRGLDAVVATASPALILTTGALLERARPYTRPSSELARTRWLVTDGMSQQPSAGGDLPRLQETQPAFLQCSPNGRHATEVLQVSHRALLRMLESFYVGGDHRPDSTMVTWLPMSHAIGLTYGLLTPLCGGFPCVVMPAASFWQSPGRWLRALSKYGGTHSVVSDPALELCVESMPPQEICQLDLSHWRVAVNADRPLRRSTLQRFSSAFEPGRLQPGSLCFAEELARLMARPLRQRRLAPTSSQGPGVDALAL